MKKLLALILVAMMVAFHASAENVNLDGMSVEQLQSLQDRIQKALWNHPDIEEVTVPAGLYQIGKDIPAGKWQIFALPSAKAKIDYGSKLNSSKTSVSWVSSGDSKTVYGTRYWAYDEGDLTSWTLTLTTTYYIEFDSTVIFRKPIAPAFTFK